jgi:hypothetical protein
VAGIPERVIAEIAAWEEETVSRIIPRYVAAWRGDQESDA